MKIIYKSVLLLLIISSFYHCIIVTLLHSHKARAQEMNSQNYRIQGGNFNMTSGEKSSTNFKLSDVVGQTAAGIFASKGYIIQAGFLNGAAGEVFTFTVLPSVVNFGNLLPNVPVEKPVEITIANGDVPGYSVRAAENQPLSTSVGSEIIDTACDEADKPCTAAAASLWIKNTAYGFGYRMIGMTVPTDFSKDGYFRPFTATKRNEQPILIMQSQARKVTDKATMTLRVAISPQQPVGLYRNVISFTAIAGI